MLPTEFSGHILIAGAGVSGRGCAAVLQRLGARLTVTDGNPAAAEGIGTQVVPVESALANLADYNLVVTSPGWPPHSELLTAAADAGIEVLGDCELAYRLDRAGVFGPPRRWLVVTGTNGKTTTTGMLAAIMDQDAARTGLRAVAVGNIGASVFDALGAQVRADILVVEMSSFQLHWTSQLRPDVGVVLNIAEDHLDWHGSFAHYAAAKAKALDGTHAVIGCDDPQLAAYAPAKCYGFTSSAPAAGQVGVAEGHLVSNLEGTPVRLCAVGGIEPAGPAGIADAAAAAAVALLAGAHPDSVAAGLAGYRVSGHRGAVVHRADGVTYVDNSKATNPHAADAALRGLERVVWIAGGQLKGADVEPLVREHAHRIKAAVLLGVDRQLLAKALALHAPHTPVHQVESTDGAAAMREAVAWARQHAEAGDTVLLAPAAASLDMYTGMGQRGDFFAAACAS
ncbi:UDP-N-acetylmuramoyl-L-alanine--D-glutamate ligase [Corynebacterium lizhenjunii]|uniref:UDP-N-acetylmuramoyl-L-alanine--D-glutamate ligase n=1 Tax=Corynebacterium lizhenjunii TaxID=2709394 RepID=UPI0013EBB960|nr:UDP-N-acetylmuramoyl-L-alanine--D-glutamate ligase [Corynebacterium lizhenjunii]